MKYPKEQITKRDFNSIDVWTIPLIIFLSYHYKKKEQEGKFIPQGNRMVSGGLL
jgi:hypothetical protein